MNREDKFSDEFLNAFVDDELTPEEKSHAYSIINRDEELAKRVCELGRLGDLLRLAYKNAAPPAPVSSPGRRGRRFGAGIAAGTALLIGALTGWYASQPDSWNTAHNPPVSQPSGTAGNSKTAAADAIAAETQAKVLFHVGTSDFARMEQTLDEVEDLIQYYEKTGQQARIEVVANGDGLNMLLFDTTPYADRILRMQRDYPNLKFVACQNTIDRYSDHGIATRLLPGTVVIDSGVAQIMRRQQQGWAYIQV